MKPDLNQHLKEFQETGFTLFKGLLSPDWISFMVDAFEDIRDRSQRNQKSNPDLIINVLEHQPHEVLEALNHPTLLDFAEKIIGPYVQLESTTFRRTPPQDRSLQGVLGYHRDMFAEFPQDGIYRRPMLFNALGYLQNLNDENGPLRILPGSHMKALSLDQKERFRPHPDEVILYPEAGDIAVFHNSLLHTGSYNFSEDYRYLFFLTLNHAWLKHREDFSGPNCQKIITDAKERKDRRLLRLLGEDDQFVGKANWGFWQPEEQMWERWMAEDRNEWLGKAQ